MTTTVDNNIKSINENKTFSINNKECKDCNDAIQSKFL